MAISMSKYVNIISGVGGGAAISTRDFGALIITDNELIPSGSIIEFRGHGEAGAQAVGLYFGFDSAEYKSALKYFSYINKYQNSAKKLSFARYDREGRRAYIRSSIELALGQLQSIISGSFAIAIDGVQAQISNIDLSSVTSFTEAANILQEAIRNSEENEQFKSALVTFENGALVIRSGKSGAASIDYATDDESQTASLLGLSASSGAVVSYGTNNETPVEAISKTAAISNNFGSFAFMSELSTEEIADVAKWTDLQNIRYMYSISVTDENYQQVYDVTSDCSGVSLNYDKKGGFAFLMPMILLACTDYSRYNGTINYMYHQFSKADFPISVDSDDLSNKLDDLRINYHGCTQNAGTEVSFYQRGMLQGEVSDAGVYANEMWLKDALTASFMNLMMALSKLPANSQGEAQARSVAQETLDDALNNGTISPGKTLSALQKSYIDNVLYSDAWREVMLNGYVLDTAVVQDNSGETENHVLKYLLVYSKGDSIRKVEGVHSLI